MKLKKAYKVMQENCGIKVGDTVKVLRIAGTQELGWGSTWRGEMDFMIGKTYTVTDMDDIYGLILDDNWYFPFFVLQKVEPKVIDEPLAVGQWFEGENGCKYTIIKIHNQFALSESNGNLCICPVNLINDVFDNYGGSYTRITTPFQVVPK